MCTREENIDIFFQTKNQMETNSIYRNYTSNLIKNTQIYEERFVSAKVPGINQGRISLEQKSTLEAAQKFALEHRVAVLNFANPLVPGGGVLHGANAQEESLCRRTNLYFSLSGKGAREFYERHQKIFRLNQENNMFLATDMAVYSPHVLVPGAGDLHGIHVREQSGAEPAKKDCFVDVITCAAPYFQSKCLLLHGDLQHLFEKRIENIFEIAIENEEEILILGAWGCGAFHNPPEVVASAFRQVLCKKRYESAFDQVIFAIIVSAEKTGNIEAFQEIWNPIRRQ